MVAFKKLLIFINRALAAFSPFPKHSKTTTILLKSFGALLCLLFKIIVIFLNSIRFISTQNEKNENMNNIIELEPYLAERDKQNLIDRLCSQDSTLDRAYLNAELSDDPDFWHEINRLLKKILR